MTIDDAYQIAYEASQAAKDPMLQESAFEIILEHLLQTEVKYEA